MYKEVWTPSLGEELNCRRERDNKHDPKAVAVEKDGRVVGHAPRELAGQLSRYLAMGKKVTARVNGHRANKGRGLVVPAIYMIE